MGEFRQRVDLVHELRELTATKEITDDRREGFGVDQLLRGHGFDSLVEKGHPLLDQALGAGQTDTALVGEQFPDGAHPATAEVVNVVQAPLALFQTEEVLGSGH